MASDAYVAVGADNGVTRSSLATSMAFFESWVEFVKKSHKNQPINLDNSLLSFFFFEFTIFSFGGCGDRYVPHTRRTREIILELVMKK